MNFRAVFFAALQTIGLYAAGFIIPLLGQALALFTPVPLILAYIRSGRREGLTALFASGVLAFILGGWQAAAILLLSFGLMAVGVAEGMRRSMKLERIALLGGFLPVAVIGIALSVYFIRIGKNPVETIEAYLRGNVAEAAKLYTSLGFAEMASMVNAVSDKFVHKLVRLIPSITIATSVTQAACCYGVARAVAVRKPGAMPAMSQPPFSLWHAPDVWVWGLIAALALIVLPNESSRLTGWNLALLFAVVYLAQGAAIVEHYLLRARIKAFIRGLIIALILSMPSIVFVIALGIVDIWADVRKVRGPVKGA